MGLRPMLYYYADGPDVGGCGGTDCVKAVMLVGTPALWWVAAPVLGWALWCTVVRRDWRFAAVLVGYAAALLPWFFTMDRQMYYFYAVALAPFYVMLVAMTLGEIIGKRRGRQGTPGHRPARGVPVPGRRGGEFRLALPDPHGAADHRPHVASAAVAAELAVSLSAAQCGPTPSRPRAKCRVPAPRRRSSRRHARPCPSWDRRCRR